MQPLLLIDWLRQLHLTADAALAAKRWNLAETLAEQITRKEAVQLLRVFLFPESVAQHLQTLTQLLLDKDSEFPASNNTEEVRLMAGIIMVAAVQKRPALADAFALGIKAAAFPKHRCTPAHRSIVEEMGKYLDAKADVLRPSDFSASGDRDYVLTSLELFAANVGATAAKQSSENLADALHKIYGRRLQQLAEEIGVLWWLLGGYSSALNQEIAGLSAEAYALIAAAEVAERTQLLPPPPSIYAILGRALTRCKGAKNKHFTLKDVVAATDATWRNTFVAGHPITDCADLLPLVTALTKLEDSGDITTLAKTLQKACPGVAADLALPPLEAARQLYNELQCFSRHSPISTKAPCSVANLRIVLTTETAAVSRISCRTALIFYPLIPQNRNVRKTFKHQRRRRLMKRCIPAKN